VDQEKLEEPVNPRPPKVLRPKLLSPMAHPKLPQGVDLQLRDLLGLAFGEEEGSGQAL
jgi:hypothetical protein